MTSASEDSDRFERALKRTGQLAMVIIILAIIAVILLV